MHFDVCVPPEHHHQNIVFDFAEQYLKEKGIDGLKINVENCRFCHTEEATESVKNEILQKGFAIIYLETIPKNLPQQPTRKDYILHIRANYEKYRFFDFKQFTLDDIICLFNELKLNDKYFNISFKKIWNGPFIPKKINIALFFQMSSSASFYNAWPCLERIFHHFHDNVGLMAVSTAVEDFQLNTYKTTHDFVTGKSLPKQIDNEYVSRARTFILQSKIAVCFDNLMHPKDYFTDERLEWYYSKYGVKSTKENDEKKISLRQIKKKFQSLDFIAVMYHELELKGIPSYVIFDNEYRILNKIHGIMEEDELERWILERL